MKNLVLFIACVFLILACKDSSDKQNRVSDKTQKQGNQELRNDAHIEDALYEGLFVKNEQGFDIALLDNILYILKKNPSEAELNNRFFLHLNLQNNELLNRDFNSDEHVFNDSLSSNYSDIRVYKVDLSDVNQPFDINVGQFTDEGRSWETYVSLDNFKKGGNIYANEYLENTITNRYLLAFEAALDNGYFMEHKDGFDVLLDDHTLYYIKAQVTDKDFEDHFFLHIKLDHLDKLYNFDFEGKTYEYTRLLGSAYSNFRVIKRDLALEGNITQLSTGQFNGAERTWSYVYDIEELFDQMQFVYNDQYEPFLNSGLEQ